MFLEGLGNESVNVYHWYFLHEYGHITIGHYQILFSCVPGISEKKATGMEI